MAELVEFCFDDWMVGICVTPAYACRLDLGSLVLVRRKRQDDHKHAFP